MNEVYIVGVALGVEAARGALADAGTTFASIDAVYAGSAHPLSPRGVLVARELGLTGIPVQHVSNASATGLAALHEAATAIQARQADVALVIGLDSPDTALPTESVITAEGNLPPAVSFALWANQRMTECGTTARHLATVAAKNWNNARANPYAARRSEQVVDADRVLNSRPVAEPLTAMMCTPWGEGAAAAVLCSTTALDRFADGRAVRLAASVMQSERYDPVEVMKGAIVGSAALTRNTARAAMKKAGVEHADIDVVQVHDAFAIEEILYYELLGFSEPGKTEDLIEAGAFGPGSRERFGLPEFSTDGGLIARGHPGGPTGLAQIYETVHRMRTEDAVDTGLCHLLGSGGTCAVAVLQRP
jgi:acetyl-CoA acetyltransferase